MRIGSRRVSCDHDWHTTALQRDAVLTAAVGARHLLEGLPFPTRGARSTYLHTTMCDGTLLLLGSTTAQTHRRDKASSWGGASTAAYTWSRSNTRKPTFSVT
jgi:hypothetical protein